jgi:plastocyanin
MGWTRRLNLLAAIGLLIALSITACNPLGNIQRSINEASTAVSAVGTASVGAQTAIAGELATSLPAINTALPALASAAPVVGTALAGGTPFVPPSGLTGNNVAIVEQGGRVSFVPNEVTIAVGGTVRFTNTSPRVQNLVADDGSWTTEDIPVFNFKEVRFDRAGTFSFAARSTPDVKGRVIVR